MKISLGSPTFATLLQGLKWSPPLKTRFWEVAGNPDYPVVDLGQKVRKSPS